MAIQHLDAFTNWLANYWENGFQSSLVTTRKIILTNSSNKAEDDNKKAFGLWRGRYELNAEEIFKVNNFYVIIGNVREAAILGLRFLNIMKAYLV